MNYKKLILVGFISAFVAVLTSVLGVAGTIIGSVISSVLYNMLSEALENPVTNATFDHNFEWDIAYAFPLIVIILIQLLLISALLAQAGFLPEAFLQFYLSIQNLTENNLYKILGLALIIMSVYPLILKAENVKRIHGIIIGFVGLVFLARGFLDVESRIVDIYNGIFMHFDFQIAVITFILLVVVLLDALPDNQREVVYMRFYQDLSFKEIAEITGVSINTALGRMRYALLNMRRIAEEKHIVLEVY